MYERFSESARQVVIAAEAEARALRHFNVGTEHELLGLLRVGGTIAAGVLGSLGITAERVREQVMTIVSSADEQPSGHLPFTPRAKRVVELAVREALSLGHDCIEPEHLLLGLVRESQIGEGRGGAWRIPGGVDPDAEKIRGDGQGVAMRILAGCGTNAEEIRSAVLARPRGPKPQASVGVRAPALPTASSLESLRCSFCGQPPTDPRSIICGATPEIAICSKCVELCNEILAEQRAGDQAPGDQER